MWNGMFSPNLRKSVDGSSFLADDGRSESELNYPDDEEVVGTITITLGGKDYEFPDKTYGDYVEFQNDNGTWLSQNINYIGDWGWPWGRTAHTGGR